MSRIFISYKRVDRHKVFKLRNQIEKVLDEKCWIDLKGIESDAWFKSVIINAINECDIFLFMYSEAHTHIVNYDKDWTIRELNFAESKNKRIVFVNIDGTPLSDLFIFDYGTKQQVDGRDKEAIDHLIYDLRNWLSPLSKEVKTEKKITLSNNDNVETSSRKEVRQIRNRTAEAKNYVYDSNIFIFLFRYKYIVAISLVFFIVIFAGVFSFYIKGKSTHFIDDTRDSTTVSTAQNSNTSDNADDEIIAFENRAIYYALFEKKDVDVALEQAEITYNVHHDTLTRYSLALCYNAKAYEYIKKDSLDKAMKMINKAINLEGDEANFYDSKGELFLILGDDESALRMWKKVLELDPNFLCSYPDGTELYKGLKKKKLIE